MSGKSSRRNKAQLAKQAKVPVTINTSKDVTTATVVDISKRDKLLASSSQCTLDAHTDNAQSSLSAQLTDNSLGVVNEDDSNEDAAAEGTSVSNRSAKRHRTQKNEADSGDDKEPAVKRSRMKETRAEQASQHTTTANKSQLEEEQIQESEDECEMETDDDDEMEQDNKKHHVYRAAGSGSESEVRSTHTRQSLMPSMAPYHQQKQTLSNVMRSSADSSDVLQSSVASDRRLGSYFTSASLEPRRRAMAPQAHDDIHERQQKLLITFRSDRTNLPSAVDDTVPELLHQKHEHCYTKLCSLLKYFVTACVVIVSAVLLAVLISTGGEPHYSRWLASIKQTQSMKSGVNNNLPVSTDVSFERLREEFPNQTVRLWRIIEAATLPVIEEESPAHPAVILLVAAKGHSAVAECLAQRYAELVTESLNAAAHTAFNCETDAYSNPDDAKRQLDSDLSGAFDAGAKAGLVLRLEKLPGPAAMIFYRFADNDNAPYKNVAIVLTLTLESTDAGSERDNVAYDELRKIWGSSLDVDKVEPLLSRIGNSVAFVRPETRETLAALNC